MTTLLSPRCYYLAALVGLTALGTFSCGTADEQQAGAGASGAAGAAGSPSAGGASSAGAGGAAAGSGGASAAGTASGGSASGGAGGSGGSGTGGGGAGSAGSAGTASGGSGPTDCTVPPPPSALVGWATEGNGTTGGGALAPVVVTTADELTQNLGGDTPRVIHISGSLEGSFGIGSNKTVIGICGAQVRGHIGVSGSSNVILRNLKVVGNNCEDSPQDCSGGADAITIGDGSTHVWVDHLDVSDGSDGNLDITGGADFVTVSWTKFSYSSMRTDVLAGSSGHRFSNLIGSSDTDARDPGHLNITYHHCWWAENVNQRMTRSRRGQIHLFNNLFTSVGNSYCTNAGQDAKLLVQNSVYNGVQGPFQVTQNGNMKIEGNQLTGTSGGTMPTGSGFTPSYAFSLDPTAGLQEAVQAGVGPK